MKILKFYARLKFTALTRNALRDLESWMLLDYPSCSLCTL